MKYEHAVNLLYKELLRLNTLNQGASGAIREVETAMSILLNEQSDMLELGQIGRDKVTGFTGMLTAKVTYLYGCHQYGLAPKVNENGEVKDTLFIDEGRVEIIGPGIPKEEVQVDKPGGVNRDAPKGNR